MCSAVHCKNSAASDSANHLCRADKQMSGYSRTQVTRQRMFGWESCGRNVEGSGRGLFRCGPTVPAGSWTDWRMLQGSYNKLSLSKIRTLDLRTRTSSGSHFSALLRRYISTLSLYLGKQRQLVSNPPQFVSDNIVYCSADCSDWSHLVIEVR
jgi:hypothetical protein